MNRLYKKLGRITLAVCVLYTMVPAILYAATLEDLKLSVTPSITSSQTVDVNQRIDFTANVENSSDNDRQVTVKSNQDSWTQIINVMANSSGSALMTYYIPSTIAGGSTIQFDFTAQHENDYAVASATDLTSFTYRVKEVYDVRMDVQLRRNQTIAIGKTLVFDVYLSNKGNMEARNIVISHSLANEEIKVSSLMPGQSRDLTFEYTIPTSTQLNKRITDTFRFEARDFSRQENDVTFTVSGTQGVETTLEALPSSYKEGDSITLVFLVKNTGDAPYENLKVTNSKDNSWSDKIGYLAVGGSVNIRYQYNVSASNETILFYLEDSDRTLLSEERIEIVPTITPPTVMPTATPEPIPEPASDFDNESATSEWGNTEFESIDWSAEDSDFVEDTNVEPEDSDFVEDTNVEPEVEPTAEPILEATAESTTGTVMVDLPKAGYGISLGPIALIIIFSAIVLFFINKNKIRG